MHSLLLHALPHSSLQSTKLQCTLDTVQEALPALYLLELQSHPTVPAHAFGQVQAATTGSHFSTAYVRLLIKEVQSVLASAGLASAAEQANRLLQACRPCADAQALQQLMEDTVRGSEVGNKSGVRAHT